MASTARPSNRAVAAAAPLPDIPTCASMRSVTMTHKFLDLYAWPGLTNQWGCAQAAMDVTAVRSIAFPPFAQGEMNVAPLGSGGELLTGVMYVDGEYFTATKTPIEFVWQPDRVERKSIYKGLELKSTTIVPFRTMSVAVKLTVTNMTKARRKTEIKARDQRRCGEEREAVERRVLAGRIRQRSDGRSRAQRDALQIETFGRICASRNFAETREPSSVMDHLRIRSRTARIRVDRLCKFARRIRRIRRKKNSTRS